MRLLVDGAKILCIKPLIGRGRRNCFEDIFSKYDEEEGMSIECQQSF
jgi:hypothetical protein